MLEAIQNAPRSSAAATRIRVDDFDFPERFRTRRALSRTTRGRTQKNVVVAIVAVASEKLFLLSVEKADNVAGFEDSRKIFVVFHEQSQLKESLELVCG